ncbi:MAG: methyltransferase domain-containing protein, partial [Actinobacteria bacterium]
MGAHPPVTGDQRDAAALHQGEHLRLRLRVQRLLAGRHRPRARGDREAEVHEGARAVGRRKRGRGRPGASGAAGPLALFAAPPDPPRAPRAGRLLAAADPVGRRPHRDDLVPARDGGARVGHRRLGRSQQLPGAPLPRRARRLRARDPGLHARAGRGVSGPHPAGRGGTPALPGRPRAPVSIREPLPAPTAQEPVGTEDAELAAFFDGFAAEDERWRRRNRTYHRLVEAVYRFVVPPGAAVLEVGCGAGDLLAALRPRVGVGVDVSPGMIEHAKAKHPELVFRVAAGERLDIDIEFDYIVLSDVVPFAHDLVALFETLAHHAHPGTRLVVNSYSQLWRPVIRVAELLRLKARKPVRNWVTLEDVRNLLELSGWEQVTAARRILFPKQIPLLTRFLNGFLANLWPFSHLCLTFWIVARLAPREREDELGVSVVCPCRNEEGNIAAVIERVPELGRATEIVFVEGGSTDGTREEIERQIEAHPERDLSLVP